MTVIEIRCGNLFLKEWNNKLYLIVHQSYSHLAPVSQRHIRKLEQDENMNLTRLIVHVF